MPESIFRVHLHPCSECYYFLPRPTHADVLLYPTSMGHEYTKKTYYVERFDTDTYMFNITRRGQGRFIYGDKSYTLEPGSLIFAYLGNRNVLYPLTDDFEYYFIHLQGGLIKEFYRKIVANGSNVLTDFPCEKMTDLFDALRPLVSPLPDPFPTANLLNEFLTYVLKFAVQPTDGYPPIVQEIIKCVINRNMTVNDIAAALNFSPIYLERQFKKYYGSSLQSYILAKKLEQAENLLLTTDLSCYEISQRLGYADTIGLIRLFRRHHDCTPLEWRKERRRR